MTAIQADAVEHDTAPGHSSNAIWDAFEASRDDQPQLFCHSDGAPTAHRWDEWRSHAERTAVGLRQLGINRQSRVATVLTNTFDVCASVIGTWLAGGTLLSLPTMRRGMEPSEYVDQLRRLSISSGAEVLVVEDRFIDLIQDQDFGVPTRSFGSLARDGKLDATPPADDEPAFVQFSSGSTSDPKGCTLSMGAIGHQEEMLHERLGVDGASRGVMWLPLSHDMGLFGCVLLSWISGMRLVVGAPERFLRSPQTWFDDCADFGATITVSPNFGLALATRRAKSRPPKGSCPMRSVVLGGERIEMATLRAADATLGPYGITSDTLTPAYGLAEGTLAVSMKRLGEQPRALTINAEEVYGGRLEQVPDSSANAKAIVSCGPPMQGITVRTVDDQPVGRLRISSPALASEYLDRPDATAAAFVGDEFASEDLGFVHDGELYVIGRTDDVLTIGGRNLHARDVELAVEDCDGVRAGCSALVDVSDDGTPRFVLAAELARGDHDVDHVASVIERCVYRSAGVRVAECVFVEPGKLPKTPSGKVQRYRARALIADRDEQAIVARVAS